MAALLALLVGAVFGIGLLVSGMTDTARVQGFLEWSGNWDPTLAFVMGGAMIPMAIAWRIAVRRERALMGTPLPAPPLRSIDARLVTGSLLFGIGWGLAGFCPGPALASLGLAETGPVVFVAAMVAGMWLAVPILARRG
ncbi:MAG: DUF6691 family protein [Burkholderiaceae bacterium]